MNRIPLNEDVWWLLCASYAGALYLQRSHLADANVATIFLVLGTALVAWRVTGEKAAPTQAKARRPLTAVVGVIAGLFIAALIVSFWPSSSSGDAATSEVVPSPAAEASSAGPTTGDANASAAPLPTAAQGPISPLDLLLEFENNPFAARQKYRGRMLEVTGVLTAVEPGHNEVPFVVLSLGPKRVEMMQALFHEHRTEINDLKVGDRVTLSCSPKYDADVENVMLSDCSVVR